MSSGALATRSDPRMPSTAEPNQPVTRFVRRRPLPATGLPARRDNRRTGTLVSLLIHALVIFLIVFPFTRLHTGVVIEKPQGAGGPGPAGGGGGGRNGTGGVNEHVHYVRVAPAPAPKPAAVIPPIVKPVPVVKPPAPQITPPQPKVELTPDVKVEPAKPVEVTALVPGTGGGAGRDGTTGSGPGTGGGVGSGIGTGRGSGTGPGTGGGNQANYPPTPTEMFIPPLPMPGKVRGFHLVAEYDVDSTGKVLGFTFTPTRDGGYNKRLEEVLKSFKFRPGTKPDGTPIRMKAQIIYDF
jgi:periplasmic protein TonB